MGCIVMNSEVKSEIKQKAFFLDRDGVINVDHGYVSSVGEFQFMDNLFDVLRSLSGKGYVLVVVTNQSGIGRGYYTESDFKKLTRWMLRQLSLEGIELAAVYSCSHSPEEGCNCRKPSPGMLLQAERDLGLDLSASWMIGDKESDMEAAKVAGVRNRVFLGTAISEASTYAVSTLLEVLELPV